MSLKYFYRLAHILQTIYWFIFRPKISGVKILVEYKNSYLLIKNSYVSDPKWNLPGGGIEKNQSLTQNAMRELFEEVGIRAKVHLLGSYYHDGPKKTNKVYCFWAKVKSNNLKLNANEISTAQWFAKNQLPSYLSNSASQCINFLNQGTIKNKKPYA